jgi:hypothetical protein
MFVFILLSDWNQEKIDIASRQFRGGRGGKSGKGKGGKGGKGSKSKGNSKPEKPEANPYEIIPEVLLSGSSEEQNSTDTTEENCNKFICLNK